MAFNFPDAPTRQVYTAPTGVTYTWDSVDGKWGSGSGYFSASNLNPIMDGTAAPGTSLLYTREDHVHPTDTSRAPLASPTFTGDPKAPTPTAGDNDTSIATTAFVGTAVASAAAIVLPNMDGSASIGAVARYAREDHIHPSDTSRVAKIGDTMTGSLTISSAGAGFLYLVANAPTVNFYPNNAPGTRKGYLQSNNTGPFVISGESLDVQLVTNSTIWMGNRITAVANSSRAYISYLGVANQYGLNMVAENAAGTSFPITFTYPPATVVGAISHSTTTTTYATTSDERLKNFTGPLSGEDAIAIIRADPVRRFTWKLDDSAAVGWSAQASYAVSPDLAVPGDDLGPEAKTGDEGFRPWGTDQAKRTPYLWAALAAALDRIDALEARLAVLEGSP